MIQLGDAVLYIKGDLTSLNTTIGNANKAINDGFGNVLGKAREVGFAMTAMGAGIVASLGTAAHAATGFQQGLGLINTLGVKDVQTLGDGILDVASKFGQDLPTAIKATYDLISSGIPEGNALDVLAESAKAAVAGSADVNSAVVLGTSILNAFGIEASEVGRVFGEAFIAQKAGVTTIEELASSVGKLSPTFAAVGLSSKEMFASLAALTLGGNSTSEAVTGMKAALSNVIKPSGDAMGAALELGIQFDATALKSMGLAGFLEMVREKTGGNVTTMAKLFGSVEALNAMLALTGNQAKAFNDILKDMENSQNATDEAFQNFVEANPAFAFEQLKVTLQAFAVEIGKALLPALIDMARFITPIIQSIREWVKEHPVLTQIIVVAGAALGALLAILGPFLIILPGLISLFGVIGPVIASVGGVIAAILSPIGLVVAAIGVALVGAIVLAIKYWDEIKSVMGSVLNFITGAFKAGWESAVEIVRFAFVRIPQLIWDGMKAALNFVLGGLGEIGRAIGNFLGGLFGLGGGGSNGLQSNVLTGPPGFGGSSLLGNSVLPGEVAGVTGEGPLGGLAAGGGGGGTGRVINVNIDGSGAIINTPVDLERFKEELANDVVDALIALGERA